MVLLLGMGIQTCLEHLYRGSEAVLTLLDCLVFDLEFYLCCFLYPTLGLLIWVVNEVLQCGSIDWEAKKLQYYKIQLHGLGMHYC
jgi:hypothetical protein